MPGTQIETHDLPEDISAQKIIHTHTRIHPYVHTYIHTYTQVGKYPFFTHSSSKLTGQSYTLGTYGLYSGGGFVAKLNVSNAMPTLALMKVHTCMHAMHMRAYIH